MLSPSAEYSSSRPFKIFISLLDKWEIGSPLTDTLLYDALRALQNSIEQKTESTDDVRRSQRTMSPLGY